jgi:hypothetical protein
MDELISKFSSILVQITHFQLTFLLLWEVEFVWLVDCEWDNLNFHPSAIFVWDQYFETR